MTETPLQALGRISWPKDMNNIDAAVNPHWVVQAALYDGRTGYEPDLFVADLKALAEVPLDVMRELVATPGFWDADFWGDFEPGSVATRIVPAFREMIDQAGEPGDDVDDPVGELS